MPHQDDDTRYAPPEARPEDTPKPEPAEAIIVSEEPQPPVDPGPPKPASPPSRNPLMMLMWGAFGCLFVLLGGLFLLALAVAGTLNGGVSLLQSAVMELAAPGPATGTVTSSQTIVNRIQPLGQLVSTSAQVARADIDVRVQQGTLGVCNHRANHVAAATIDAGINLLEIGPQAVTYDETTDTYTLYIPRPSITSCSMDFIDQYDRQVNGPTCAVDWDDIRQIAQYTALVEFRDEVVEDGLLVTAERDAEAALVSFVSALTGSAVVVEFTDTSTTLTNPAAACDPELPRDWQQDPETGAWVRVR